MGPYQRGNYVDPAHRGGTRGNQMQGDYQSRSGTNPYGYPPYPDFTSQLNDQYHRGQQNDQNQATSVIYGRYVNSIDEIFPNEIPMDGTYCIFPKNDLEEIYVKFWTKDVKLISRTFILKQEEPKEPTIEPEQATATNVTEYFTKFEEAFDSLKETSNKTTSTLEQVSEQFSALNDRLTKMEKLLNTTSNSKNTKKEIIINE